MPPSIFEPRHTKIPLDNPVQNADLKVVADTQFRKNPIAMLVEDYGKEGESGDDSDSEDEGNEMEEGEGEGEQEEGEQEEGKEEQEDEVEEEGDMSMFRCKPSRLICLGAYSKYVVHVNFGNEELTSAVRVKLLVPEQLEACLGWINEQKTFSFSQVQLESTPTNISASSSLQTK